MAVHVLDAQTAKSAGPWPSIPTAEGTSAGASADAPGVALLGGAGAFLLLAGITASKALASGLFLGVVGAASLPAATIIVSIAVAVAGGFVGRAGRSLPVRRLLRRVLGTSALALALVGWRVASHEPGRVEALLLLLACAIGGTLGVALAWTAFRSMMQDARRGLLQGGAFALLGGACGSQMTIVATPIAGVGVMVVVCAALLLAGSACLDAGLASHAGKPIAAPATADSTPPAGALVRSIAALAFLVVLCSTLAEFQFACAAVSLRQGPEALATYISSWQLAVSIAALPVHVVLGRLLLRRDRLQAALLVAPAVMLAAGGAMILLPGISAALAMKATDGAFRHSFQKAVLEVCLFALPEQARVEARMVADTLVDRGAQAAASGLLWALTNGFGLGPRGLGIVTAISALAWLVAALRLGGHVARRAACSVSALAGARAA